MLLYPVPVYFSVFWISLLSPPLYWSYRYSNLFIHCSLSLLYPILLQLLFLIATLL